jgi:hypothetical protein
MSSILHLYCKYPTGAYRLWSMNITALPVEGGEKHTQQTSFQVYTIAPWEISMSLARCILTLNCSRCTDVKYNDLGQRAGSSTLQAQELLLDVALVRQYKTNVIFFNRFMAAECCISIALYLVGYWMIAPIYSTDDVGLYHRPGVL